MSYYVPACDKVRWTHTCWICSAVKFEDYGVPYGGALPNPCLPEGWRRIFCGTFAAYTICDKHVVFVEDSPTRRHEF